MDLDLNSLREYFSTQPVEKAWLFGSFARGEANQESDVDILISFNRKESIGMKFIKMINDLEDKLHRHVDLVEEGTLLPWIRTHVDKDKVLIYEREN